MIFKTQPTDFKIFIVDDSDIVLERLKHGLNELPHTSVIGTANNITDALSSIKESNPNVAILDIHLKHDSPQANGTDLLIMLRKVYPDMLIIMLSNITTPQYIKKCLNLGANYFLDKSNDFDKIPKILSRIYNHRNGSDSKNT